MIWTGFVGFVRTVRLFTRAPLLNTQLAFWTAVKALSLPLAETAAERCERLAAELRDRLKG